MSHWRCFVFCCLEQLHLAEELHSCSSTRQQSVSHPGMTLPVYRHVCRTDISFWWDCVRYIMDICKIRKSCDILRYHRNFNVFTITVCTNIVWLVTVKHTAFGVIYTQRKSLTGGNELSIKKQRNETWWAEHIPWYMPHPHPSHPPWFYHRNNIL
jgi:hypothetical protein